MRGLDAPIKMPKKIKSKKKKEGEEIDELYGEGSFQNAIYIL